MSLLTTLNAGEGIVAPGVYDALTALLAEQAGFRAAYVSGASVSYSLLGRPDLGFVSLAELAAAVEHMRQRTQIDLIVDADTGFGNAINVLHTVKTLERAGATVIQLEDQKMPKRCGHLKGKQLISKAEMIGKVKAAVDARTQEATLIMARTDAIGVEGLDAAIERAAAYQEAGADILFIEAPQTPDDYKTIAAHFGQAIPLLANLVDGAPVPLDNAQSLHDMGFKLVVTAGSLARATSYAAQQFLKGLHANGSTAASREAMLDFKDLNDRLGLPEMLERGKAYGSD